MPLQALAFDRVSTPIGDLLLAVCGSRLAALGFADRSGPFMEGLRRRFGEAELQPADDPFGYSSKLRAYFAGDLGALDYIPADPGGTPFQAAVWRAVRSIGPGRTCSYGELARLAERPKAARAVGAAMGRNPIALVIPCHRVIGEGEALAGYGGGLDRKRWLLEHEGALRRQ